MLVTHDPVRKAVRGALDRAIALGVVTLGMIAIGPPGRFRAWWACVRDPEFRAIALRAHREARARRQEWRS